MDDEKVTDMADQAAPLDPDDAEIDADALSDGEDADAPVPPEADASSPDVSEGTDAAKTCPSAQCRYDKHEEGSHFCILCGTLLFTHCTDCLANNPPYAHFCHYCGSDLAELKAERAKEQTASE